MDYRAAGARPVAELHLGRFPVRGAGAASGRRVNGGSGEQRACSYGVIGEVRKYFFFEKKKQKTFVPSANAADTSSTSLKYQKFFGSFFQKRTAFLTLACPWR
jgi:hypothetical protein